MIIIDNSNVKLDHLLIFLLVVVIVLSTVLCFMYCIIVLFGSACIVLFSYYVVYRIVL